jgi:lysophospholipase L1-like esterase
MIRIALLALFAILSVAAQPAFHLSDGDRVVFYGDSITDQRLYTTFVETYVRTRFPNMKVKFTHSGWGGDRVSGGGGGLVETRIYRDVAPYRPTVVTIMLGMNDARYRTFDEDLFKAYAGGYQKLVSMIRAVAPGARITAIRPSPYDEVTRAATVPGGYNPVLVKYGDFLAELAANERLTLADLNAPVVKMLQKANAASAADAQKIIPDKVHPGAAGHLIMAGALLKDWNAPALVSAVTISSPDGRQAKAEGTKVENLSFTGPMSGAQVSGFAWTQTDEALPMPINFEDPVVALAVRSSEFVETLNRQTLKITNLRPGQYALRIDAQQVGVFTDKAFAAGLDLASLPTPMARQAAEVHQWTLKRTGIHNVRWRTLEVPLADDGIEENAAAMNALDELASELEERQIAAAQPVARRYEVVAVPASAATVPQGFTPVFNGKDLTGWHISKTNHHGTTPDWKVVDGVLTGSQQPAGKGGILLTDKRYKNFEVYAEINPDWGCDGGLFLRSSEKGEAYQVLLDYREGGTLFGVYGERLQGVPTHSIKEWEKYYKKGEWNAVRARIQGEIPRITVWVNGEQVTSWSDTANHAAGNAVDGMIAVQVHGGNKIWKEGGQHRFRNIAVRELP